MFWLLVAGCRRVSLSFVLLSPSDIEIEQAHARLIRYRLTECDGGTDREWVGRRIDLRNSSADLIRDRSWCRIDLELKEAPVPGPPLGWSGRTAGGTDFTFSLSPGTTVLQQSFGGSGEDLVLVLDLSALVQASEIDDASALAERNPISFDATSDWSQEHALKLPEALSVVPRRAAAAEPDWVNVTVQTTPNEQGGGCRSTDTATDWGETGRLDSGTFTDTGEYPSIPTSTGCQCGAKSRTGDSGEDSGQPEDSEDTGSNSSSSCSGEDSGDTGLATMMARRGGLATLLVLFCLRRRQP